MSKKDPGKPSNGKEEREAEEMPVFQVVFAASSFFPVTPHQTKEIAPRLQKSMNFQDHFYFISIDFNIRLNFKVTQNIHWESVEVYNLK